MNISEVTEGLQSVIDSLSLSFPLTRSMRIDDDIDAIQSSCENTATSIEHEKECTVQSSCTNSNRRATVYKEIANELREHIRKVSLSSL